MSTQYECLKSADLYAEAFGVAPPEKLPGKEVWPRQQGLFIRKAFVPEQPSAEPSAEPVIEPVGDAAAPGAPTSPLVILGVSILACDAPMLAPPYQPEVSAMARGVTQVASANTLH